MSIKRNRANSKYSTSRREYRLLFLKEEYPPFWDDGIWCYPGYRAGYKNPNKFIFPHQVRMYRTWKHNRYTQWKNK